MSFGGVSGRGCCACEAQASISSAGARLDTTVRPPTAKSWCSRSRRVRIALFSLAMVVSDGCENRLGRVTVAPDGPWTLSSLQRDTRRPSEGVDRRVVLLPVVHSGHLLARAFRREYSSQRSAIAGQREGIVIDNLAVHLLDRLERAWTRAGGGYGVIRRHRRTFDGTIFA